MALSARYHQMEHRDQIHCIPSGTSFPMSAQASARVLVCEQYMSSVCVLCEHSEPTNSTRSPPVWPRTVQRPQRPTPSGTVPWEPHVSSVTGPPCALVSPPENALVMACWIPSGPTCDLTTHSLARTHINTRACTLTHNTGMALSQQHTPHACRHHHHLAHSRCIVPHQGNSMVHWVTARQSWGAGGLVSLRGCRGWWPCARV